MRIKHTPYEYYGLYFDYEYKGSHCWYPYKLYSSKQNAIKAANRINDKRELVGVNRYHFKIVWSPSTWATEDKQIVVYTNENEVL